MTAHATLKPDTAAALRLLRSRGADGVTTAEARAAIGSDRFAARVWELIHWHHVPVVKVMERAPNGDRYARYSLAEPRPEPTVGEQLGVFA